MHSTKSDKLAHKWTKGYFFHKCLLKCRPANFPDLLWQCRIFKAFSRFSRMASNITGISKCDYVSQKCSNFVASPKYKQPFALRWFRLFLLYLARSKQFPPRDYTKLVISPFLLPWNGLYHFSSFFFVWAISLAPCNPMVRDSINYRNTSFLKNCYEYSDYYENLT